MQFTALASGWTHFSTNLLFQQSVFFIKIKIYRFNDLFFVEKQVKRL